MTIRHLRIFKAVYESRNMTESAKQLYMTQPSVSQGIRELEDNYELKLFERLHRQLYPTAAADRLYTYATKVIEIFDEMEQQIYGDDTKNKLRIGATDTINVAMIGQVIKKVKQTNPEGIITIDVHNEKVLNEMLRKNELDLALMDEQIQGNAFIQEVFTEERMIVAASPANELVGRENVYVKDLIGQKLFIREQSAEIREYFKSILKKTKEEFVPFWKSSNGRMVIEGVKEFEGIAILPFEFVKNELKENKLVELTVADFNMPSRQVIVYHVDKDRTELMKKFIEVVKDSGN